jgi:hypothetical protein
LIGSGLLHALASPDSINADSTGRWYVIVVPVMVVILKSLPLWLYRDKTQPPKNEARTPPVLPLAVAHAGGSRPPPLLPLAVGQSGAKLTGKPPDNETG